MTDKTIGPVVGKYAGLAARALELKRGGVAAAAAVREGAAISDEAMTAMREMASLDKKTDAALAELAGAREDIKSNPFARREWLRGLIDGLAGEESPDPEKVIAFMFSAMGGTLPNGDMALPLFKRQEGKQQGSALYLPRAFRERNTGKIVSRGLMVIIPVSGDEEPRLKILRSARREAAKVLVEHLEGETLVNLSRPLWLSLFLMDNASVYSKKKAEEAFENGDGQLLTRKRDGRQFVYYPFSDDEVFVYGQSDLAERFVKQLAVLADVAEKFWAGKMDVETDIIETLEDEVSRSRVISPSDYLKGLPGICAVVHDAWKVKKGEKATARVIVLFDRPVGQAKWRWVFGNPDAVQSLFGGKQLRFHEMTGADIPPHVAAFLRSGKQITVAG